LWRPTPPLAIRFSAGTGYRAPDFKELYIDFVNANVGYTVIGNPDLQPEHSLGIMTDIEWAGTHYYGRADGFYNRFRDFIQDTLIAPGLYSYSNVAHGTTSGIEVEGGVSQGPVHLEAGYAYLYTHNDATGGPLVGRPTNSARMSVGVGITQGFSASVTGLYTGVTPMTTDALGVVTSSRPAYLRFDLRAVVRLPYSMELVGGADNLFDAKAGAGWPGFTGRVVYAGMTWRGGPGG
jgi:outer membrane receptor for ferrienterochelin and colicins